MYRYELYNVEEIEKLKKELNAYKKTMGIVTERKLLEDYLRTKEDFYNLKMEIFKLKGEMEAMENNFQEEYLKQQLEEQRLVNQQASILNTLEGLDQRSEMIKLQLEQLPLTELFEKIDQFLKVQNEKSEEQRKELESLKEEMIQIKELMKKPGSATSKNKRSTHKSEYKQLHSLLQYPNQVEQQSVSKKKNNQVSRQHHSLAKSNQEKPYYAQQYDTKDSGTISMNTAKKTFLNSQYELNKNIIIRTATPKSKSQVKNKEESQDTDHKLENNIDNYPQEPISDNTANNKSQDAISNTNVDNQDQDAADDINVDNQDQDVANDINVNNHPQNTISDNIVDNQDQDVADDINVNNHPQEPIDDTNIDNQTQATTGEKVVEGNAVYPNNEIERNKNNTDFAEIQLEDTENKIDLTDKQVEKTNSSTTLTKKSIEGAKIKQQYFTQKQVDKTENNKYEELNKKPDSFSSFLSLFKRG
ncbi:hypothetical protein [Virgibacillus chiguensis]|uniref:Uncharacterized protein n=1 Tax=Virgibacillus chiguensis TaxID=411959 RepID=A0A1M5QCJ9_9BACI|nr:hypothetical protein [Virgibacillus chiguensis]SHH11576.1 hypothetical protein SAMN05421807_10466 [Virgibacillus chiguensis]